MTEAPLLAIHDLSVAYGDRRVVNSVTLELARGCCLGVIGESGAGKSQAFLALLGLSAPGAQVTGEARLGADDLLAHAARLRGRRVAMVFQDPLTSLTPHLRIGEQLSETLRLHRGLSQEAALARAAQLLEQTRVNDVSRRLRQYPHELSGGMRQRVMIALALAGDPELLIADEPTTALDVSVQSQILALLRELVRERGMSLVVVTHDMGVIAALADDVVVMRHGSIVDRGPVARLLLAPTHEYTRELVAAVPRMADTAVPRMDDMALPRRDDPAAQTSDTPLVAVRDARVRYRLGGGLWRRGQDLVAVDGVSLEVRAGEAVGLVGESGCGKSSLARALLRLQDLASGDIVWLGRPIQNLVGDALRPVRAGLQLVFQDPVASLDPLLSVAEVVAEPLQALRPDWEPARRTARVRELLADVGLGAEFATRRAHTLSGGQCQRVAIARAMAPEPKLLVCDEAVSSLDVSIQAQILALLADIKRRGTAMVFVSHNLAVVRQLCERVLVMYLGRVVESGTTSAVFRDPRHPYTRLLLDSVPLLDPERERQRLAAVDLASGVRHESPSPVDRPSGCAFRSRCPWAQSTCAAEQPITEAVEVGREVACHRWRDIVNSVPLPARNRA